jgi:polysaccharide export outer membrane protein
MGRAQTVGQSAVMDAGMETNFPVTPQKLEPSPTQFGALQITPEDFDKITLGPSFVIAVDVIGFEDLSHVERRLDAAGRIQMPMMGSISLAGLSLAKAEAAISGALVEHQVVVAPPQVNIKVLEFPMKYINVVGEVRTPGRLQALFAKRLSDVLANAGGENYAAGNDIEIQHTDSEGQTTSRHVAFAPGLPTDPAQKTLVEPGDTVFVSRAAAVYVLGAVSKPGGYLMVNNDFPNVMQALALAGGLSLDAAKEDWRIVRPTANGLEEIKVSLSHSGRLTAANTQLQLNDVLYIPHKKWKAAVINGGALLGSALSSAIYRAPML